MPKGLPKIDPEAIRRAEASLQALSTNFDEWIKDEVAKLTSAHAAFTSDPTSETLKAVYGAAHDLKGQGATYNYPLITDLAGLLCKLLDDATVDFAVKHKALVVAHVQATQAALSEEKHTQEEPEAKALIATLKKRVLDLVNDA